MDVCGGESVVVGGGAMSMIRGFWSTSVVFSRSFQGMARFHRRDGILVLMSSGRIVL